MESSSDILRCSFCGLVFEEEQLFGYCGDQPACLECMAQIYPQEEYNVEEQSDQDYAASTTTQQYSSVLSFPSTSSMPVIEEILSEFPRTTRRLEVVRQVFNADTQRDYLLELSKIQLDIFRNPVICPIYKCRRTTSVTKIHSHFQFEHLSMPKIILSPGVTYYLNFSLDSLERMDGLNDGLLAITLENIDDSASTAGSSAYSTSSSACGSMYVDYLQVSPCLLVSVAKMQDHEKYNYLFYVVTPMCFEYTSTLGLCSKQNEFCIQYSGPVIKVNENHRQLCKDCIGLYITATQLDMMRTTAGSEEAILSVCINKRQL